MNTDSRILKASKNQMSVKSCVVIESICSHEIHLSTLELLKDAGSMDMYGGMGTKK